MILLLMKFNSSMKTHICKALCMCISGRAESFSERANFLEDKGRSFDLTLEVRSFKIVKTTPLRN